jgi:hypothetical protein
MIYLLAAGAIFVGAMAISEAYDAQQSLTTGSSYQP